MLLFAAALLGTGWAAGCSAARAGGEPAAAAPVAAAPRPVLEVVVGERDTLWGIAERRDPGGDAGALVRRIVALNGLGTTIVQPGQRLRVP